MANDIVRAVLSNAQHPEYGQYTLPFPIPDQEYGAVMEALASLGIGDPVARDCRVDEIDSVFPILKRLEKVAVNVDELDYLAKRLDSFDVSEAAKFQAMTVKMGLFEMTDLINLTFCCQQATVITDFSDLSGIGQDHYMDLRGGCCSTEELEQLDARKVALNLILNDLTGRITPYGVVYDNGMQLEQLYDGRHFPCYLYQPSVMVVGIAPVNSPDEAKETTWLPLPCAKQQIERAVQRSGIDLGTARIWYEEITLPAEVMNVLNAGKENIFELNDMTTAIVALSDLERKKLVAVMEMAKPEGAREICELAKNLELFEFAPNVRTPAEYGRYMIQDSGHFAYDPNLDEFYDYERCGRLHMVQEDGAFTERGYVAYCGAQPLEELMAGEQSQGPQMGGLS